MMETTNSYKIKNSFNLLVRLVRYNMRIIFAQRFIWFFLLSLGFLIFIAISTVLQGDNPDEKMVYGMLIFPGVLLIFYPMTFGIQGDVDAGILEILFGIPDYRYKVWLVRLLMVFVIVFLILYIYAGLASIFLAKVDLFSMTLQLMFPVLFIGTMAFMFSTLIKNGYGTAAVMAILGVILMIIRENLVRNSQWDVFLNPYDMPDRLNEVIWDGIILKNKIFLMVSSVAFLLFGLFNLQKRERFI